MVGYTCTLEFRASFLLLKGRADKQLCRLGVKCLKNNIVDRAAVVDIFCSFGGWFVFLACDMKWNLDWFKDEYKVLEKNGIHSKPSFFVNILSFLQCYHQIVSFSLLNHCAWEIPPISDVSGLLCWSHVLLLYRGLVYRVQYLYILSISPLINPPPLSFNDICDPFALK